MRFDPANHLPEDVNARLAVWDENPEFGPPILTEQPATRLGHYFESLYHCLMSDLLGWEVLLKNRPIRNNGITLGELDFIVRNPTDGAIEHHEIAVKFYLGFVESNQPNPRWYGPNATDRLDLKTRRLIEHQSQLTNRPETRQLLASVGIETPVRPRIFMPGYLFYPMGMHVSSPDDLPSDHLRGDWLYIDELEKAGSTGQLDTTHWIPLIKPHWLGPWHQASVPAPDNADTAEALEMVRSRGIPRLFAVLERCQKHEGWCETGRVFVMPRSWPKPQA